MNCPNCGAPAHELKVLETRQYPTQVRRRKECTLCEQRFSTVELVSPEGRRLTEMDVYLVPKGSVKL